MDIKIFEFLSYRKFLEDYLLFLGAGGKKSLAGAMEISSSMLSQILSGDRDLSAEQAFKLSKHLNFNSFETQYWLNLIEFSKAASCELENFYLGVLQKAKQEFESNDRVRSGFNQSGWTDEFVVAFYSTWEFPFVYSALRTKEDWTIETLALRLNISVAGVKKAIELFTAYGMVKWTCDNRFRLFETGLHFIEKKDSRIHWNVGIQQHKNMRIKAISLYMEDRHLGQTDNLYRTYAVAVSKASFELLKQDILNVLDRFNKQIAETDKFEEVVCLNIDLMKIVPSSK